MVTDLQKEILRLKKEQGVTILAHSYQNPEILEIADFTGDSFQLSVAASKDSAKTVIMCGVHFMAETVKLLSPEKRVILSHPQAGCPMAEQFTPEEVLAFRREHPDFKVVAYINTTAALKAVCDVCVTSASAVKICRALESKNILFIPDCNLGSFVQKACPDKNIVLWQGGCPLHAAVTEKEVKAARELHPEALLLTHPECPAAIAEVSDYVGSTSGIMDFAKKSEKKEFIIGTENSIVSHLSYACPEKRFYPLSKHLICADMKLTTLPDVYRCLTGEGGLEIEIAPELMSKSRVCIDEMLRLG